MISFSRPSSTHLGSLMPPDIVRLLAQEERKKAMQAEPKEREQHFEQANKWMDMLGAYNLMRYGVRLGD